jgi:hypothetical protein
MEPDVAHILQFFSYDHLPAGLQEVSKLFAIAAQRYAQMTPTELDATRDKIKASYQTFLGELRSAIDTVTPPNQEATWAVIKITEAERAIADFAARSIALRYLLEAKDCAVRAMLAKPQPQKEG